MILVSKAGHKRCRCAVGVKFGMHSSGREDGHVVAVETVVDGAGTVLHDKLSLQAAFNNDVHFCGPRVGVWCVKAAAIKEAEGHADAAADEGRESGAVGAHAVPT